MCYNMHMKTLREYLYEIQGTGKAIPHFNVSNSDMLMAVFDAAQQVSQELGEQVPIIIGVSEGERDAFGVTQFVDYVASLRAEHDYPIFTNADHTYSVERTCEAIDAGFDMVIYDGNEVSYEENLANTKAVVKYRDKVSPECLVEAELGFIGSGSNIKESLPEGVSEETMTKPDEALTFIKETGIDVLAPSVGNVHGMVKGGNPRLNPERVAQVIAKVQKPLVLHGGSGSTDEDFRAVIDAGISIIHISTELRVAFRKGLEESLAQDTALSPYSYVKLAKKNLQEIAADRIKLFYFNK
jgi:fructose-bisphosphate aldolase class II